MALTRLRPSLIDTATYSSAIGAPTTQVAEWVRAGILVPAERTQGSARRSYLFSRDDVLLGAALLQLQELLGQKSKLAYNLARQLVPHLRGVLDWHAGTLPTKPVLVFLAYGHATLALKLSPELFAAVARRLDELA
jgi:hypothetical protein